MSAHAAQAIRTQSGGRSVQAATFIRPVLYVALCCSAATFGAEPGELAVDQTIEQSVAPGDTRAFHVSLGEGDYFAATIEQRGTIVDTTVWAPHGQRLRRFIPLASGKFNLSFVGEAPGSYRLELTARSGAPAGSYSLKVEKILPAEQLRPAAPEEKAQSPRIEALRQNPGVGNSNVAAFWTAVSREGTPIIEPLDDKQYLVTFLWRGEERTRSVRVLWPLRPDREMVMTQLAGTNLWYKSQAMPRGARFTYKLAPNIPLLPGSTNPLQAASATARADPLNPRRWSETPGASEYEYYSLAELPGATPQPWAEVRPEVQRGKVEEFRIASALLKNERTVAIYTPNGYATNGERYPLLVVFDDPVYRDLVPTPTILDNLIAAGRIPPMLAAMVGNPTYESRRTELLGSEVFIGFLATELVPWLRARYHVSSDPRRVVIGGSSAGGFTAAYAGLRHPELFGKILSQSGSFWWSPTRDPGAPAKLDENSEPAWLLHQFAVSPRLPLEFYLDAGWFELGSGPAILDTNRYLRDVLLAKGYAVHHREFIGGHDYVNWRGTLADGLLLLMGTGRNAEATSAPRARSAGRGGSETAGGVPQLRRDLP